MLLTIDEERLFPVYKKISDENLILVMHTGFDFAFAQTRIADPEKILTVVQKFPALKFITTHLGAWNLRRKNQGHPLKATLSRANNNL